MSEAVLDASALLALLLKENGWEAVEPILETAVVSTINLAEVVSFYARAGTQESLILEILESLSIDRVDFDEALAIDAGLLVPLTRHAGLSLGDRACLALARRLGARVVTADRAWKDVADATGVTVELIR